MEEEEPPPIDKIDKDKKIIKEKRRGSIAPKIAILIQMQFLNDIIKSGQGFKATHKFRVFSKTLKIFEQL